MSDTVEAKDAPTGALKGNPATDESLSANLLQSILAPTPARPFAYPPNDTAARARFNDGDSPDGSTTIQVQLFIADAVRNFEITQIEHRGEIIHWFVVLGCGDKQIVCDLRADHQACLDTDQMSRLKSAMTQWASGKSAATSGDATVAAIISGPSIEPFTVYDES